MSVASSEAPRGSAAEKKPCRPPASQAIMPIIEIAGKRLAVHYRESEAVEALRASAHGELYDIRGARVKLDKDQPHLKRSGKDDPNAVRDRIIAVLAAFGESELDGDDALEMRESIAWLREAPNLTYMVGGLCYAPIAYARGLTCNPHCTATQRADHPNPPCCPSL
jgi:hypothetical protein